LGIGSYYIAWLKNMQWTQRLAQAHQAEGKSKEEDGPVGESKTQAEDKLKEQSRPRAKAKPKKQSSPRSKTTRRKTTTTKRKTKRRQQPKGPKTHPTRRILPYHFASRRSVFR